MTAALAALRALLSDTGYRFVEPAILHDATIFLDVAGEDLRRRLFLTDGPDGSQLCLRPEFTIPVCLEHIASGDAHRPADYAYLGPVFRHRPGEPGEFLQAGVESLGRTDRITADADILALAIEAVRLFGFSAPIVRIGDSLLFATLLDTLGVAASWRRRLARVFGDRERLGQTIARLSGNSDEPAPAHADFLAALEGSDHESAHKVVEDLLSIAGIRAVGGRTAGEIADRFLEQAALRVGAGLDPRARAVIARFLAISGTPEDAARALRALGNDEKLALAPVIEGFEKRAEGLARRGIDLSRLSFAADFGRRLDYYSGFVFEIHDPALPDGRQIVGGGRYDRLMPLLGAKTAVPAVGFALWVDRASRVGAAP